MIKILVADDHPIVRQGLKQILSEYPDMTVADEAGTGKDVLVKVGKKILTSSFWTFPCPAGTGWTSSRN